MNRALRNKTDIKRFSHFFLVRARIKIKNYLKVSKSACKNLQLCEHELVGSRISRLCTARGNLKLVDKLLLGSYTILRSLTLFIGKAPKGECVWMKDRLTYDTVGVMGDRTRER